MAMSDYGVGADQGGNVAAIALTVFARWFLRLSFLKPAGPAELIATVTNISGYDSLSR
jgi:hypothetical protein